MKAQTDRIRIYHVMQKKRTNQSEDHNFNAISEIIVLFERWSLVLSLGQFLSKSKGEFGNANDFSETPIEVKSASPVVQRLLLYRRNV